MRALQLNRRCSSSTSFIVCRHVQALKWRATRRAASGLSQQQNGSSDTSGPCIVAHARLADGRRWEFRANEMARLASGSVVLNTDEDNAILGTVVCKYAEKLLDEEAVLRAVEESERAEREAEQAADSGSSSADAEAEEKSKMAESETANGAQSEETEQQDMDRRKTPKIVPQLQGLALTVDYRQSAAAIGRIPTNYFRREMQQSEQEIAISRMVDRSLRPTIHPRFSGRTHVVCKPLALDDTGDTAVMAVNVAAAALAVSPVPQRCLLAAARVGIIDGKIAVNPSRERLKHSTLDLLLTGTECSVRQANGGKSSSDSRVLMIEMEGKEVELDTFVECVQLGFDEIRLTQRAIERLAIAGGQPKYQLENDGYDYGASLLEQVAVCEGAIEAVLSDHGHDKQSRGRAIEEIFQGWSLLVRRQPERYTESLLRVAFTDTLKRVHRRMLIEGGLRADGRHPDEFRPIQCRVDLYRKLHGSALFQRGQSQVLSTVTFDSPQAAFHPDAIAQLLGAQRKKSFMLHYEFPQFATNEIDTHGSGSRREIGHGLLAEKALRHVMPDEFPYTIRLACQVLESNGSTSMASVCAGSLALFDAGVPLLTNHVAGMAMGLVVEEKEQQQQQQREEQSGGTENGSLLDPFPARYQLLTDLAGFEDFSGDMDFKIAGSSRGFTAMQMDLKICGLPLRVFRETLQRSKAGLDHVLGLMRATIAEPRPDFKPSVPIIELLQVPLYKRPVLFRSGAYNAKLIEAETGVKVSSEDDTNISLFAPNRECLDRAKEMIAKLMEEQQDEQYQFGAVYKAEIVRILDGGVQVTLKEGGRPIWIRNSDLSATPGRRNAAALGIQVGQFLTFQYFGRDQHSGQHRLTRKTLQIMDPPVQNLFRAKEKQGPTADGDKDEGKVDGRKEATTTNS